MDDEGSSPHSEIRFCRPDVADGPAIWQLVRDLGVLDVNSTYAYLLLCRDFADTCVVARRNESVLGFVTGYRPPPDREVVFVWQVGVSPEARGQGLAGTMLDTLVRSEGCRGVRFLETTVTASNEASRRMFGALARRLETELTESPGFGAELFPGEGHEAEPRLRIGPFDANVLRTATN